MYSFLNIFLILMLLYIEFIQDYSSIYLILFKWIKFDINLFILFGRYKYNNINIFSYPTDIIFVYYKILVELAL